MLAYDVIHEPLHAGFMMSVSPIYWAGGPRTARKPGSGETISSLACKYETTPNDTP